MADNTNNQQASSEDIKVCFCCGSLLDTEGKCTDPTCPLYGEIVD